MRAEVGGPLLILTLWVLWGVGCYGAPPPSYTNAYLRLGVTARDEGVGRATLGAGWRPGGETLQPASLASQDGLYAVTGAFALQFGQMGHLEYLSYSQRIDGVSAAGLSLMRFGVDGIQNTLNWRDASGAEDYNRITRFSTGDWALRGVYAREVWGGIRVGGMLKVLYQHIGPFADGWGVGVDLGAQWSRGGWGVGLAVRDAVGSYVGWSIRSDRLQIETLDSTFNVSPRRALEITLPSVGVGGSYEYMGSSGHGVWVGVGFEYTSDGVAYPLLGGRWGSVDPQVGLEWRYTSVFALRLGARGWQFAPRWDGGRQLFASPSAGIGLAAWGWRLDYSLWVPTAALTWRFSHLITLSCTWGRLLEVERETSVIAQ